MIDLISEGFLADFPPLGDRALLELLNTFDVVEDQVRVQQARTGLLARAFDSLTGVANDRQTTINQELIDGVQVLHRYVSYLDARKVRTQLGLVRVAESCCYLNGKMKAVIAETTKIEFRLELVETGLRQQIKRHDAHLDCETVSANLAAGTYGEIPILLQVALAIEDLAWRGFFQQGLDPRLRELTIGRLSDAAASRSSLSRQSLVSIPEQLSQTTGLDQETLDAFELFTRPLPTKCPVSEAIFLSATRNLDEIESVPGLRRAVSITSLVDGILTEAGIRFAQPAYDSFGPRLREVESQEPPRKKEPRVTVFSPSASTLFPEDSPKIGIVLSGGGAKGAYLVGVLRAMAEMGIQPATVSGTSIGALNGAIVASQPSLTSAADCLESIWDNLARRSPLEVNYQGLAIHLGLAVSKLLVTAYGGPQTKAVASPVMALIEQEAKAAGVEPTLFLIDGIVELLQEYIDFTRKDDWLPFWVAAFRASYPEAFWEGIKGCGLKLGNREAEFFKIQDLHEDEALTSILASAAIPALFPGQSLGNDLFFDGGIGGGRRDQGTTPAQPLAEDGCDLLVVTHLSNGSLWDRRDFPQAECVIDIRPSKGMGGFGAMFNFDHNQIRTLRHFGYEDTMRRFEEVFGVLKLRDASISSDVSMAEALANLARVSQNSE